MDWGLCIDAAALSQRRDTGTLTAFLGGLQKAGIEYLELPVSRVMGTEAEFDEVQAMAAGSPLPVRAFNSFLPGTQRITGPNVNWDSVLEYCRVALARCRVWAGMWSCSARQARGVSPTALTAPRPSGSSASSAACWGRSPRLQTWTLRLSRSAPKKTT